MISVKLRAGFDVVQAYSPTCVRLEMLWVPNVWLVVKVIENEKFKIVRKFKVVATEEAQEIL